MGAHPAQKAVRRRRVEAQLNAPGPSGGSVSGSPFSVCPVGQPRAYSDSFGAPRYAGGYHPHAGNDIMAPRGTPIYAPFAGSASSDPNGLGGNAVIVRGNQILAAGCVLPLAEEGTVRERMGTRHRAGLGLSMQTDAVVLILSEELGQIAVAHEGKLLRNLDPDRLRQVLTSLLQPRTELHRPPLPVWRR